MSKYHLQTREKVREEQQRVFEQQCQEVARNCELLDELKKQNLEARETERGVVVNLPDVLFTFGKTNRTPGAHAKIEDIAKVLNKQAKARRVSVEGHTDSLAARRLISACQSVVPTMSCSYSTTMSSAPNVS